MCAERPRRCDGFTTAELMVTVAIALTLAGFSTIKIIGAQKIARDTNSATAVLGAMRLARQTAIDLRKQVLVQFTAPQTLTVTRLDAGRPTFTLNTVVLASDVQFYAPSGIPTSPSAVPDGFGAGNHAIDFSIDNGGQGTSLYFQPDGSALDSAGRINNGIAYLARPGDLNSPRAVTLYGATGRTRSWRLMPNGTGGYVWK